MTTFTYRNKAYSLATKGALTTIFDSTGAVFGTIQESPISDDYWLEAGDYSSEVAKLDGDLVATAKILIYEALLSKPVKSDYNADLSVTVSAFGNVAEMYDDNEDIFAQIESTSSAWVAQYPSGACLLLSRSVYPTLLDAVNYSAKIVSF